MVTLESVSNLIKAANNLLDFVFLWGGLFVILLYPLHFFVKSMAKYDKEKHKNPNESKIGDLLTQTFILFLAAIIAGGFWVFPELFTYLRPEFAPWLPLSLATGFRWALIGAVVTLFAYIYGHEYGERRWLNSCLGHIALIFFGLVFDGWMGVIFISLPILLAYYSVLYRLAMVILPTATPEDPQERWKRYIIFVSYVWGLQFPLVVVEGHAWAKPETRINGDFTWDYPVPGLVWTKSHHVVGITGGSKFKRVAGPGLVFTGKLERAEQIFDLRLQLRTNEIEAVTKDGISLKVRVFTAFRIDPEDWSDDLHKQLRRSNPLLREARIPSYTQGSFRYSPQRVQATLGITSTKAGTADATLYWDQWALNVVEDQARKVVAQKKLDELWRLPEEQDKKFANAMDVIANEIKAQVAPILRAAGILLIVSRIVNFSFPTEKDQAEITQRQIATWGSDWEEKRSNILAEAQAESERTQQEARAYAASLMLNAIAEGLQMTEAINPNLPRHVIALLFLSSLQDYIEQQPEDKEMEEQHHLIKKLQEQVSDHPGKKS